jgi:hypothetical protein
VGDSTVPLEQLAIRCNREWPNLFAARRLTAERMAAWEDALTGLNRDPDAAVVLMGSWGRQELTTASDDDYMVLVDGQPRDEAAPTVDDVATALRDAGDELRAPGREEIFGKTVFSTDLIENIGLDRDNNRNLTRRMLLLLESSVIAGDAAYKAARTAVLRGYLDDSIKDGKPPRFLLNDIVRYWRTICVDFVGKERTRKGQGWGLRNAKLRTSRKMLFAGGLIPALRCHEVRAEEMQAFLETQFDLPPTDRVAEAFITYDAFEEGGRTFDAYDEFLGLVADSAFRVILEGIANRAVADRLPEFQRAAALGTNVEEGLLGLLFSERMERWTRDFAIF